MNEKIRRLTREIERRGGMISGIGSVPDKITELFLLEVLSCPDCLGQSDDVAAQVWRDPDTGIYSVAGGAGVREPIKGN